MTDKGRHKGKRKWANKPAINIFLLCCAALAVFLSVWGPEAFTDYNDKNVLNNIKFAQEDSEDAGYRYSLSSNEKLFILSECLNSQNIPESEMNALTRVSDGAAEYSDLMGTYAFVLNHKGPTGEEITNSEIYDTCNQGINMLKELGILPNEIMDVSAATHEATLYSAIDVPEPRNNVAVWKLSLANDRQNANKENRLIDAYIDADDGRIYEFYARTNLAWEDIDADELVSGWSGYMGLGAPQEYETDNPLLETTPYYKKYVFEGMGDERTIVTVGFYDGINELFLKISK